MPRFPRALGVALAGVFASSVHASVVIDDFSSVALNNAGTSPWPVAQFTPGSVDINETGLTGVLGGVRHTTTTLSSVALPGVDFMQTSIIPGSGVVLDYASSTGADGQLELRYDGGSALHADFSQEQGISIGIADFDYAFGQDMPVTVTLYDGRNGSASLTRVVDTFGETKLEFLLREFRGAKTLDLTNISSVVVGIDPGVAADYRLSSISTIGAVPAPGAVSLLTLSGLVAARGRRRR